MNLLYSVYSCEIELYFVSVWRFVPPKRVTLRNTLFGLNFPLQVYWLFGRWESKRRDLLMDHRNLNKCKTRRKSDKTNLSLTNRLSLDREYTMQCSAVHHPTTTTTLNTLYCNIQTLMRKFYFWNYFHFYELKLSFATIIIEAILNHGVIAHLYLSICISPKERSRLTLGIHLQGNI